MEANNCIVTTYIGINRSSRTQTSVMIWTHISIKSTIINYTYWRERIIEAKLNIGKGEIIIFWTLRFVPER